MGYKKIFFIFPFILFAGQSQYWDEGSKQVERMLGEYKNNFEKRVKKPITQEQKLYTLDNSKSANVSLDCGREYKILKLTYYPGNGGDININIQADLNLDDKYEKSFVFYNISGVCANGVIKCNSGTWNNCKYYQVQFNGTDFSLKKVEAPNVWGCYCINSSCGDVYKNYNQTLSTLTGIFSSVLNHSYYIISNAGIDGTIAYLYGKGMNCGGKNIPAGMSSASLNEKTEEAKKSENYTLLYEITQNEDKNSSVNDEYKNSLKSKYNTVSQNSKYSDGTYSYNDGNRDVSGKVFVGDIKKVEFCEVEWIEKDTQSYSDNTNKTSTSSATTKKSEIIECRKNTDGNWYCPVEEGRSIKHDCGKINDFAEVVSALNGIEQAVKDLTCSKE